jgi:hypothetical protein
VRQTVMRLTAIVFVIATCWSAERFAPNEVRILGDIDYGQTSPALDCPGQPGYCALVFNAGGGDRVQASIKGGGENAFVAFADGTLAELARGSGELSVTLPRSEDPLTYYVLFRSSDGKPATLAVELKKLEGARP